MPSLSAHEAVERLKPRWLQRRGRDSVNGPFSRAVIVDGVHRGGLEVLERYQASELTEIRYMDASQAQVRYGDRAGGGAILLTTIRG